MGKEATSETVQWFPGVEIAGVEEVQALAQFSRDGSKYYITGLGVEATKWLPVDGEGMSYSFAFWDVEKGDIRPITTEDPLYLRAVKAEGWGHQATVHARLVPPAGEGFIRPGEWVVRTGETLRVYSDDEFRSRYIRAAS